MSATTIYDVDVDAWSCGTNSVIMNIHRNGIINDGSSHKRVHGRSLGWIFSEAGCVGTRPPEAIDIFLWGRG